MCSPKIPREGSQSWASLPVAHIFLWASWYPQSSVRVWERPALPFCHLSFLSYVSSPLLLTSLFQFLHWTGPWVWAICVMTYMCWYTNKAAIALLSITSTCTLQVLLKEAGLPELPPSSCFWDVPWRQSFRPLAIMDICLTSTPPALPAHHLPHQHTTCLLHCCPHHTAFVKPMSRTKNMGCRWSQDHSDMKYHIQGRSAWHKLSRVTQQLLPAPCQGL